MTRVSNENPREFGLPAGYLPRQCSLLWQTPLPGWRILLEASLEGIASGQIPPIFCRADDIGAGGRAFEALCRLFRSHQIPLGMAVVPAWLSEIRKSQLFAAAPLADPLWGWHQHGWRHVNWQRSGKNSEFGEQRPFEKQWRDIKQGQQKMQDLFEEHFIPVFTPPWNRLSNRTLRILQDLGFEGVSMGKHFPSGLKPTVAMKNLRVNFDLHTRKAKEGASDYHDLLEELTSLLGKREPVGIMIHHQRMNSFAFEFLDELLGLLKRNHGARFMSFRDILDGDDAQ